MVNIHVAVLPWNRGADPNFWSWFDGTPKGASIHYVDAGLDTGPVTACDTAQFGKHETLRTSYGALVECAVRLFSESWPDIRRGSIDAVCRVGAGSYHRSKDKDPWWGNLPLGYDTPVSVVEEMGLSAPRF